MMGNNETGNYMAEVGSVKSEKQGTQDRTLRDPIREWESMREAITQFNLLSAVCDIIFNPHQNSAIHAKPIPEPVKKKAVVNSIICCREIQQCESNS